MKISIEEFSWINKSELKVEDNKFFVKSTSNSDFFCNPIDGKTVSGAPFLYKEIKGDFLISVRVKPVFTSTYEAGTVFAYADDNHWLKLAFEYTDLGAPSVVTVATDIYSDDANGVEIKEEAIYLQIMRKGDIFVCHYSIDGKEYKMVRILKLVLPDTIKIGVSAQSPTGAGNFMEFSDLKITQVLPEDIRKSK